MELESLLDQPHKLPTIPKVAQQLIKSFNAEDVTVEQIAQLLAADPALSAKLLRLANSAYFHVSRKIGTVDDALRMLGFVMVRNLVLGSGVVSAFRNTPGMQLQQFWRYNLYTACAARWLAATAGANQDLVFTVGLLQGVGQLQMHAVMPAVMAPIDQQIAVLEAGRSELESRLLGFHHGDVAAALAKLWNFPPAIVLALRNAPQPLAAPEFSASAAWLHLGAWRARCEILALSDADQLASYPAEVGRRLGVAPAWTPALAAGSPELTSEVMPRLAQLTEGMDAMLD